MLQFDEFHEAADMGKSARMRGYVGGPGKPVVMSAWVCRTCDVQGRDFEAVPNCWSCGDPATVTARPTVMFETDVTAPASGS